MYDKIYQRKYRQDHKKEYNEWQRNKRRKNLELINKIKINNGCKNCGLKNPVCLDFHHLDRNTKEITISNAVWSKFTIENLMKEIQKCVVLCRNCHSIEEDRV